MEFKFIFFIVCLVKDLTSDEKQQIVAVLSANKTSIQIAKQLKRDHRTVKKFTKNCNKQRQRADNGTFRSKDKQEQTKIKRSLSRNPLQSRKIVFEDAEVSINSRATRCRFLKSIAKVEKAISVPILSKNKKSRLEWCKKYHKLFSDECRASLNGPDGLARGWVLNGVKTPHRMRRQQCGGGVLFWAAMHKKTLIGPFRIDAGVKMNYVYPIFTN